jgi:hypothetical protein
MKYPIRISSLVILLATAPLVHADAPPPLTAAVLDFKEAADDLAGTGASISALLQVKLSTESESPLVERAELKEVLSEQELTLTDSVSPGQAARLGQLTGAEVLVSGRVFAVQNRVYVVAKMISSSTGRVFGVSADFERQGKIDSAVSSLSTQIAKTLKEKRPELASGRPLEERQLETIQAIMKDHKSPKIHVSIKELILSAPAPDPAAQTELCRTLQAAGWTVVATEQEADLVVTGEAFAETGIRRGNLWFVRARLEFTIKNAAEKILKSDRIVAGNVDLAEAVGNKGALQKTGLLAAAQVAQTWASAQPAR